MRPQRCSFINSEHTSTPSPPIFNLCESPLACHPGAAETSLNNSNHCFCQLTSSARSLRQADKCGSISTAQMRIVFINPPKCECLVVAARSSQHACLSVSLIFYLLIQSDGRCISTLGRHISLQLPLRVLQRYGSTTEGDYKHRLHLHT